MTKIWFVRDYLSGGAIDNIYFSTKAEAVKFRNDLEYGIVTSYAVLSDEARARTENQ